MASGSETPSSDEVAVLDGPTRLVQARYRYDEVGNLRFETDANGNRTEIVYAEDRNLPVRVILPRVEGEAEAPFRVTTYDANGNPETITNENGQVLTVQYDGLDRLIRSEFGGEVTTYAYDPHGNLRYATPPESQPGGRNAGRVRVMHYDAFDRLERVVEPNGLQTQYRYDPNGNLVGVTDPSNRRTEYRYDRLNRRTHHVVLGPDDAVETDDLVTQWELDANGNARRITDPLGQVVEYEYDELDRRELGTFPVRAPLEHIALESVRWVYDANGNVEGVTATKVAPDVPRWTETTVQRWDALDRLEATTTRGVAIALEYDAAGNRTLVSTAEGSTAYAYDARHRLDYAVVDSERVEYTSLTDGRRDSVLYPNGTRTTYGYHPQTNRLTSLNHERNDGGGWTSFARAEVDWDRNGNRLEDRITIGGVTETTDYAYDVLDRMVRHSRQSSTGGTPETVTYTYSGYERQVERTIPSLNPEDEPTRTRTYTYEPSYGWLTQVDEASPTDGTTTITYGYDRNGNTSWRRNSRNSEEMRFTYDVFDQLQHVERGVVGDLTPGTSLGRYDYDVDGRRIRVRGGDRGDVDYYYDGLSVLQEMRPGATPSDDPTELLAHYRYADRLLSLDRYLGSSGGLARQWYHHDTLGSVMALSAGVAESEAAGTMLASYRYDPYGAIREQTGDSVNRAGFTGHQQDRETGLIYMNARYYDPAIGRFLTADSYLGESGNPPSLQRYLYGFGNPGRWVDPTGHFNAEIDENGKPQYQFDSPEEKISFLKTKQGAYLRDNDIDHDPASLPEARASIPARIGHRGAGTTVEDPSGTYDAAVLSAKRESVMPPTEAGGLVGYFARMRVERDALVGLMRKGQVNADDATHFGAVAALALFRLGMENTPLGIGATSGDGPGTVAIKLVLKTVVEGELESVATVSDRNAPAWDRVKAGALIAWNAVPGAAYVWVAGKLGKAAVVIGRTITKFVPSAAQVARGIANGARRLGAAVRAGAERAGRFASRIRIGVPPLPAGTQANYMIGFPVYLADDGVTTAAQSLDEFAELMQSLPGERAATWVDDATEPFIGPWRFRKLWSVRSGKSDLVSLIRIVVERCFVGQVLGAHRGAIEAEDPASVEDAIDDRVGEIVVV